MSPILKKTILFFLLNAFTIFSSSAEDFWVNTKSLERFYLSVEQTELGFKLHHYHQTRGDYPDHLSELYFKDKIVIPDYVIEHYPDYRAADGLDVWPVVPFAGKSKNRKTNSSLWSAANEWNEEWEKKYSLWIQTEIEPDFYHRYNIATDCADAVIGLRWIFARMNSLPVANTLAETEDLFGHYSMRRIWIDLPTADIWYDDKLFLTALKYVMDLASTRTINLDAYPVKLTRDGLMPGTFILTQNGNSGHVKFISENHYDENLEMPLYTLSSTSPRDMRLLAREVFIDQDWPQAGLKEILAFRWPVFINGVWQLKAQEEHAQYSLEQFDIQLKENYPAFINFVVARVKNNYDPLKLVDIAIDDILATVRNRTLIVERGFEYCSVNDCSEGTIGNEEWSTPSRDLQLSKKFEDIDKLVRDYQFITPSIQAQWIDGLRQTNVKLLEKETNLSVVRFIVDNKLLSSSPFDTPSKRWGFNKQELVSKWVVDANKLFSQRDSIIEKTDMPCKSKECFPKNNLWQELNTYHVDTELNRIYVLTMSYCSLVDKTACDLIKTNHFKSNRRLNNKEKTFAEWFMTIPYFHSDPRVTKARRWGEIPENAHAKVLPYYTTIKIAKNSLALIDGRKIYNLLDGSLVTEIKDDNRIFLSDNGMAFKINDTTGELKRLSWSADGVGLWRRVADREGILLNEKNRKLTFVEDKGYFFFRKPVRNGQFVFTIRNDVIELIAKSQGATSLSGALMSVAIDNETIIFYDLEKGFKSHLSVAGDTSFVDMRALTISSYAYPEVLLDYRDRDNDSYFPVLLNIVNSKWKKIEPLIGPKFIVKWSSASQRKAIVQTNFIGEFPELHAIRWNESGEAESARLGNLLLGVKEKDEKVYFINGTGGQWDQSPQKDFMVWDEVDIKSIIAPMDTTVRFFSTVGPYFSSETGGILASFESQKTYRLPKDVLEKNSLCDLQINSEKIFSYRFSSSYGDYSCMGGGFFIAKESLNDEVIPDFTLYSWLSNESLHDQRWQTDFSNSVVKSGTLIAVGKNLSLWWKPKE